MANERIDYKNSPLKVVTLFSGYDSQCLALERLKQDFPNFNYDLIAWSDIDKYAIKAHNALFPKHCDMNLGDVCKINWGDVTDFDLLTYSFPCTSISSVGHQKGIAEGSGTASSLLWECQRAIEVKRPKFLLMENVKALVQRKFKCYFDLWLCGLEGLGYKNFWTVLDSKDYGVPQSRQRVFCVSILDDDLWNEPKYDFPQPFPLVKSLSDILESNASEEFYLSNERTSKLFDYSSVSEHPIEKFEITDPKILSYTRDRQGRMVGRHTKDVANTLHASHFENTEQYVIEPNNGGWRVRKLTPRERFRLMDVDDNDIDKILSTVSSKTQLQKLSGNSIVVNCLYHIFRKMFINETNDE